MCTSAEIELDRLLDYSFAVPQMMSSIDYAGLPKAKLGQSEWLYPRLLIST